MNRQQLKRFQSGAVALAAAAGEPPRFVLRILGLASRTNWGVLKDLGSLLIAPFVGLAFVVLLPFILVAVLCWAAAQALVAKPGDV